MLKSPSRRIKRVRNKISGTAMRPRLAVFRSNRALFAQLIDDNKNVTIASVNEKEIKNIAKETKAAELGRLLARKAKTKKINQAVFDRRGYKYHGQIKKLADGAREEGLKI